MSVQATSVLGYRPLVRAAKTFAFATLIGLVASTASASEELPPLTPDLLGISAIACVKLSKDGDVTGAFLITSTGADTRDQHLLEWIKQLHWPPAAPGEKLRDTWFPMPVAFGEGVEPPKMPASCSPLSNETSRR